VTDLVTRPATAADAPAIFELVAACAGAAELDPDSVVADLGRPALDLARDTVLVLDPAGDPVGWAWVHLGRRARVDVRTDHLGRGLGTRLLGWTEARARELGSQRIGQNVADANLAAAALLRGHGYEPRATNWLLEIAMTAEPAVPEPPPSGVLIRPFRSGDGPAVHRLIEDAFNEWQQRPRQYDEWAQLLHAFRGFYRHGRRSCALWTHSDTQAFSLYQRLGMTVRETATHFSRALR